MKVNNIKVKTKRKFKSTTDSNHNKPIAPNILSQDFMVPSPNRVWTSDISYIKTGEGWLYLCIVLDLFSRSVVGWSMGERMKADFVEQAIISAVKKEESSTWHYFS